MIRKMVNNDCESVKTPHYFSFKTVTTCLFSWIPWWIKVSHQETKTFCSRSMEVFLYIFLFVFNLFLHQITLLLPRLSMHILYFTDNDSFHFWTVILSVEMMIVMMNVIADITALKKTYSHSFTDAFFHHYLDGHAMINKLLTLLSCKLLTL
jgi:hypothetical protein